MPNIRTAIAAAAQRRANRERSASLSTVAPAESSEDYLPQLAIVAASILYRSPLPSLEGRPVYVLNAAAFPDAYEVDYDSLLAYVLARLPGEDELISGTDYEIVFLAGGTPDNATAEKKQGPSTGWYLQAYHVLGRATRKKLQRLYIVHPRTWVRVLISVFGTIVSPKFRRKIVHVNSLSQLALQIPIEQLMIPPSAYLHDRKVSPDVYAPFVTGRRAFGARHPLPMNLETRKTRLPRVLRETTTFLILPSNLQTEGLFRVPPHNVLSGILKEAYDRGQQFIVWKEKGAVFAPPGTPHDLVDEVRLEDAYGVHLAASLIKTWYRELREPIFPESIYPQLRERYGDPNVQVTPEELVDILFPSSKTSPLTRTSREILTRHLFPLLSTVAASEASNKMNSENLAILFSMCLLCGSNQMEDGKMSLVIKRILRAGIEMWPELRSGMGIDAKAFAADIDAPTDRRDYEDPLEETKPPKPSIEVERTDSEGHRIVMSEDVSPTISPEGLAPALPPRRSRAASLKKALTPNMSNIHVEMPSFPKIDLHSFPKRKPAPHHSGPPSPEEDADATRPTSVAAEPPRYSTVFDVDGRSIHVADTPANYAPANGFGPPKRANFSFEGDETKSTPRYAAVDSAEVNPMAAVPKRKAVSGSHNSSPDGTKTQPTPDASETNALLARMAAQQAANNIAQRVTVQPPTTQPVLNTDNHTETPGTLSTSPADLNSAKTPKDSPASDGPFRKPSWPASANRQMKIESFARPVHSTQTHTVPIITRDGRMLQTPHVPKPRTPSPGLLKRMSSMENQNAGNSDAAERPVLLRPNKLNLRKTSVDDLRRLYEERVSTAQNLVELGRRTSTSATTP